MDERTTRRSFLMLMTTAVAACLMAAGSVLAQPDEDEDHPAQVVLENARTELVKLRSLLADDDIEGTQAQMGFVRDELTKLRSVLQTG